MKLLDVLTAPWAIVPEKLVEIQAIYATHLRGEKIDIAAIEARLGRPLANEQKPYEIVDGVAVIDIEGVIAKRMNFFMRISGGASSSIARSQLAQALEDPEVKAILLNIDSPGGTVDGTAELAQAVYEARARVPVVAYTDGMMCSAAYWIGSAAHRVLISGNTTQLGSIGVVAAHVDVSRMEERMGVKTTEIVAGKYKRIASQYGPLTGEGWRSIQEQVDYIYSAFVGDVARFRGVSEETALEKMADGRIFVGKQAIDAGLADGMATLNGAVSLAASDEMLALCDDKERERKRSGAGVAPPAINIHVEGVITDPDALARHLAPEIAKAGAVAPAIPKDELKGAAMKVKIGQKMLEIEGDTLILDAAFVGSNAPEVAAALRSEGAAAERERVAGIDAVAVPGYEQIVAAAKGDGKSTASDVSVQIAKAEKDLRAKKLDEIRKDGPDPVKAPPVDGVAKPEGAKDFETLVSEYQAEHKCTRGDAIRATVAAHPEAHAKYVESQPRGQK